MLLTTTPDIFVRAPLARCQHCAVKEERETQMVLQNETVGMENSATGNNAKAKWHSERKKTLPGASVNTGGAPAFRLTLASMLNSIYNTGADTGFTSRHICRVFCVAVADLCFIP